jgi:hypothetical protein
MELMRACAHRDQVFGVCNVARKCETFNPGSTILSPVVGHDLTELIETDGTAVFVFAMVVRFVAAQNLFIDIHAPRFNTSLWKNADCRVSGIPFEADYFAGNEGPAPVALER